MRKLFPVLGLLGLALILAAPANANPISGSGCLNNSCLGNTYTLTYNTTPVSTTATTTTWAVTLTIDTNGYTGASTDVITSVSVKVSSTLVSASLTSFPAGSAWGAVAVNSGLNASGCSGAGNGFACTNATTALSVAAGIYSWTFNLEVPNSNPIILTPLGASIKVGFTTAAGKNAGITSENIDLQVPGPGPNNPVPEPSSLALLGTGLVGVAGLIRRRLTQ